MGKGDCSREMAIKPWATLEQHLLDIWTTEVEAKLLLKYSESVEEDGGVIRVEYQRTMYVTNSKYNSSGVIKLWASDLSEF